jgi:hypothetical protein
MNTNPEEEGEEERAGSGTLLSTMSRNAFASGYFFRTTSIDYRRTAAEKSPAMLTLMSCKSH